MVMVLLETMPSEVFMPLDLKAYRIGDLIAALGNPPYEVVGLPPHEKLHEQLGPLFSDQAKRLTVSDLERAIRTCVS
jgi:hypothetical protein